jgi:hypothetical protein
MTRAEATGWRLVPAVLLCVLAAVASADAAAGGARERVIVHVDANPVDYCLYDGRPYSEGAFIDSPGGPLLCTYRERDPATGEVFLPVEGNRRLKWMPADAAR